MLVKQVSNSIFLGTIACAIGVLVAVLPIAYTISFLAIVVLGFASVISPLSVLGFLLILSPLRTLVATEAGMVLPLDPGQALFFVFILTWAANHIFFNRSILAWQYSPIMVPLIGFIGVTAITAFSAASLNLWLNEWLKWVIMFSLIIVLQKYDDTSWQWIVFSLVVAGIGNAVVGLYIFFGGSGADHLLINGRFFRAFGTFGQPNPFGGFMGLVLPLAIMMSFGHLMLATRMWYTKRLFIPHLWIRCGFYCAGTITILAGMIASWSRGAWLGFLVSVVVMAIALPRKFWQSVGLSLMVGLVVGTLWVGNFIPGSVKTRVTSSSKELFQVDDVRGVDITSENYAIVERLAHWQAALNMARAHPWLGVGFGNFEAVYNDYRLINWDEPLGHAHNYYLNILAETGMIGVVVYLALWLSITSFTWRIRSHPDELTRTLAVGFLGVWAYLAVHSMLDNLYVNNLFIHLGVMFGLLAMIYQNTYETYQWG